MSIGKAFRKKFQMDSEPVDIREIDYDNASDPEITPWRIESAQRIAALTNRLSRLDDDHVTLEHEYNRAKKERDDYRKIIDSDPPPIQSCQGCARKNAREIKLRNSLSTALAMLNEFCDSDWYEHGLQVPDDLMQRAFDFTQLNDARGS